MDHQHPHHEQTPSSPMENSTSSRPTRPSRRGSTLQIIATSTDGASSFTACTYAGELSICAFGFNSNGVAFTLDSVPLAKGEVAAGAIAVNFMSRDLLHLEDAMRRVCSPGISVRHCYNLMDVRGSRIVAVETASGNRFAVHEASATPFFHVDEPRGPRDQHTDIPPSRRGLALRRISFSQEAPPYAAGRPTSNQLKSCISWL